MGKNVDKIYTEKFDFDPGVQFFMDFPYYGTLKYIPCFQIAVTRTMFDLEISSFVVATWKEEVIIKSYGPDIV